MDNAERVGMSETAIHIEAAALTAWAEFIELVPSATDDQLAKRIFICGFSQGASWAVTYYDKTLFTP